MNKNILIVPLLAIAVTAPGFAFAREGGNTHQGNLGNDVVIDKLPAKISTEVNAEGDDVTEINPQNTFRIKPRTHASTTVGNKKDGEEHTIPGMKGKGVEHADGAISARIDSLMKLSARIATSKVLSATTIASIQASLSSEIQALNDLKVKIGNETSTTTMREDVKSITKDHRVYLLVEPKARIAAAAGRITAVVAQFTQLSTKLSVRIDAAAAAGTNVTAARAALTDLNAKIADAKVQADTAVSLTATLSPDGGDSVKLAANTAALNSAREKLATAEADLKAARKDAWDIMKSVKGTNVTASSTKKVESR